MRYDNQEAYDSGLTYDSLIEALNPLHPMAKIRLNLKKMSITALIAFLQQVFTKLTGNATFNSLAAQVTALNAATTALVTKNNAYNATVLLADQQLSERNDQRDLVENLITLLASGVENVAAGDAAKIQSAGFTIRSARAPVGLLPAPADLVAEIGRLTGTVDLGWETVKGAGTYIVECAANPNGPWTQSGIVTKSSFTCTGLTSGTKYYFRVRAVGAAGSGPWSDIAEKMAA